MRTILIILLILFVFCGCAMLGYQAATSVASNLPKIPKIQQPQPQPQPTTADEPDIYSEQHNFIVVQVDQLDAQSPTLETIWLVSVFFLEDVPPSLAFVQLYSPQASTPNALSLTQAFSLTPGGEPSKAFWNALDIYGISFEGYFMVDRFSTQYILEWALGPGDHVQSLLNPETLHALAQQTCQSISGMAFRETAPFEWKGLTPLHFRSDMRMAVAMEYWNQMTSTEQPLRCDLIPAK